MKAAWLPARTLLHVSGKDAAHFLHNLLTNSVEGLTEGEAAYAALLTPQGKIIGDIFVLARADGFLLDVPVDRAAELTKRLTLYKLRAAVTIAPVENGRVLAVWDTDAPPPGACADPRLAELGFRLPVETPDAPVAAEAIASDAEWHAHRILLGVPEGGVDFLYDDAFPHEADLDQLNGIDFAKGCYIGQEIVSRMEHRGTARTRTVPVTVEGAAPPPGTEVRAGDKPAGALGSSANGRALARLRLDRVEDALAANDGLSAGESTLALAPKPAWVRFRYPGEGSAAEAAS